MFWIKLLLLNLGTLAAGALAFWGISALVALAYRPAGPWVFSALMAFWIVVGLLYSWNRIATRGPLD